MNEKIFENISPVVNKFLEKGNELNKIYLYVVPFELEKINLKLLKEKFGAEVIVYSVKDENKYDPENKSKKAIPGMPGVYFE